LTVAIVDLGLGNLASVRWALARAGSEAMVTRDPDAIAESDGVVLPGVGHFEAAARCLHTADLASAILSVVGRRPILGICLGMQLLFERSEEGGRGLGILAGSVTRLEAGTSPLPHVGWNTVEVSAAAGVMARAGSGDAYFCHAFAARPDDHLRAAAHTQYGERFVSAVHAGLVSGVQFHPEKSGRYGAAVLEAFVRQVAACSR
jgi:glutamine amidotransferase